MNEDKVNKFKALISDNESSFVEESKVIVANEEWLLASAGVIFMLMDFMASQSPKMKKVQLAKELGVSAQYVGKLLRGEENLTLQTLTKIAHVMNLTLMELMQKLIEQLNPKGNRQVLSSKF